MFTFLDPVSPEISDEDFGSSVLANFVEWRDADDSVRPTDVVTNSTRDKVEASSRTVSATLGDCVNKLVVTSDVTGLRLDETGVVENGILVVPVVSIVVIGDDDVLSLDILQEWTPAVI